MRCRSLAPLAFFAASIVAFATVHCGGSSASIQEPLAETGAEAAVPPPPPDAGLDAGERNPDAIGAKTSSKIDLLLVVDNSASMGEKAKTLAVSVGTLLRKVSPGHDVHVGVISSSLGTFGGDVCPDTGKTNSLAHLSTVGPGDVPVAGAAKGFLSYSGRGDVDALVADAASLVNGMGEGGCGFEAQLESAYRFLVQPDPWQRIALGATSQAQLEGLDQVLLAQRKAFLRPDSLVIVLMLTDEDDSSPDPRSVAGQGWAYAAKKFPGSQVFRPDGITTTAPRATSACATNPASADCTSCGFAASCNVQDAACQKIKSDPACQQNNGYHGPTEDHLNVRFHRMKERYGVDPQYPISRYVDGFTKQRVPNRRGEHVETGSTIGGYVGDANCTNPLFAADLPTAAGDCNIPLGPRGKELVVFAVIGGVPASLVGPSPDWTKILGANPGMFDFAGIDPHMTQSVGARPGLAPPSAVRGDNGPDPVHGREWSTGDDDLQFACTVALATPRVCSAQDPACDCASMSINPPLCGPTLGEQLRQKAYPTIRELRVVKGLGDRGVAGSICSASYAGTMNVIGDRVASRLTN